MSNKDIEIQTNLHVRKVAKWLSGLKPKRRELEILSTIESLTTYADHLYERAMLLPATSATAFKNAMLLADLKTLVTKGGCSHATSMPEGESDEQWFGVCSKCIIEMLNGAARIETGKINPTAIQMAKKSVKLQYVQANKAPTQGNVKSHEVSGYYCGLWVPFWLVKDEAITGIAMYNLSAERFYISYHTPKSLSYADWDAKGFSSSLSKMNEESSTVLQNPWISRAYLNARATTPPHSFARLPEKDEILWQPTLPKSGSLFSQYSGSAPFWIFHDQMGDEESDRCIAWSTSGFSEMFKRETSHLNSVAPYLHKMGEDSLKCIGIASVAEQIERFGLCYIGE